MHTRRLINQTKNTVISENVCMATSLSQRAKGLLGKARMEKGEALVIDPCNSIHTFFMRFPIDVLFVSKDHVIVKTVTAIKPFRLKAAAAASYVVELPAGTALLTSCEAGDSLRLE